MSNPQLPINVVSVHTTQTHEIVRIEYPNHVHRFGVRKFTKAPHYKPVPPTHPSLERALEVISG